MANKPKKAVIKISTFVDSTTRIEGDVFSENNLKIDGTINGNLESKNDIVVSETGVVNGNIYANAVVVNGVVAGNITTIDTVTLAPSGRIEGDVEALGLIADIGSNFHGRCKVTKIEEPEGAKFEIKVESPPNEIKEEKDEQAVTSELLAQVANEIAG
ncbi:MAG: polymer-forming cytoskeletal protein [Oscillospiraceae bacterium]|nr:polymer-forming cytoskeletal protein [Oscillospiraceae bacterium]